MNQTEKKRWQTPAFEIFLVGSGAFLGTSSELGNSEFGFDDDGEYTHLY